MLKVRLQDGREFAITQQKADALRAAKSVEKSTDMFTITSQSGQIVYEWEYRSIKEFVHHTNNSSEDDHSILERDLLIKKKKREEWTELFLKENDYDGTIIESYRELARKKMETAFQKRWIGDKFVEAMARCLLRLDNKCPHA